MTTRVATDDSYRLQVVYSLQSPDDLEKKYDHVATDPYDGRPWMRHSSCTSIDETPGERTFWLTKVPVQYIGKPINEVWKDLADYFNQLGYRFAIEVELDAFGTAYPSLQCENPILALGSSNTWEGHDEGVACLECDNGERWLSDFPIEEHLTDTERFLLIKLD